MKVGIVGNGVVGSATASAFRGWADDVLVWDLDPAKATHPLLDVAFSDVVFLCLPTPTGPYGRHSLTAVECAATALAGLNPDGFYVLRSTVPPGTTRRIAAEYGLTDLWYSPEFLTARTAEADAKNPTSLVVGRLKPCGEKLEGVFRRRWPNVPVLTVTAEAAEFGKLAQNAAFAAKVALFNELRCVADAKGVDWAEARAVICHDGRVPELHTHVPGPDGMRGFGGACLPKDLKAFVKLGEEVSQAVPVAKAVASRNQTDRR